MGREEKDNKMIRSSTAPMHESDMGEYLRQNTGRIEELTEQISA
jgi:Tfp pilus assembly protein PilP